MPQCLVLIMPARHPPPHHRDGIAWERGRPARILSLWPPLSFSAMLPVGQAEGEPWRRSCVSMFMAPFPVILCIHVQYMVENLFNGT